MGIHLRTVHKTVFEERGGIDETELSNRGMQHCPECYLPFASGKGLRGP
jgi:hypothetical protein